MVEGVTCCRKAFHDTHIMRTEAKMPLPKSNQFAYAFSCIKIQ